MYLRSISLKDKSYNPLEYPFSVPAIQTINEISFEQKVTFFVGENGSGKSTLLEAIASQCGFPLGGGGQNNQYHFVEETNVLAKHLRLSWLPKINKGFFLRAESFHQFATHIEEVEALHAYGGQSLHQQSHGESFMSLFQHRFGEKAIYLLDEPEAALSPQRQLTFLKLLHDFVNKYDCQFIIATHSPILLGYPEAKIYQFEDNIQEITYEETDHYQITKYFLMNRERFLHQLFKDDTD